MKRLLTGLLLTSTLLIPALAQDPPYPEDSCLQCFEDSLSVGGTAEDKCLFVLNHCSPCYHVVVFWCEPWGVRATERQREVEKQYNALPVGERRAFAKGFLSGLEGARQ